MKRKSSRPVIIQNISWIYKKNVKYDKNQINLLFFVKNRCRSQYGHNKFFKKKILGHQSLLFLDTHNVIFDL